MNVFNTDSVNSTSSFNASDLLQRMETLRAEMQSQPNLLVMTRKTVNQLKQISELEKQQFAAGAMPELAMNVYGLRYEEYDTASECFDRMMNPRAGERLQLVMAEEIPVECINHPWVQSQFKSFADKYKLDIVSCPMTEQMSQWDKG